MDEREFITRTTGGAVSTWTGPSSTKKGDRIEGLVVLFRRDPEHGAPILVLGPPKDDGRDF